MEAAKKHIGTFDFWGVFGAGVVILTSYIIAFCPELVLSRTENTSIVFFVAAAYTVGLILYCISSSCVEVGIFRFSATGITSDKSYYKGIFGEQFYNKYLNQFHDALNEFNTRYNKLKLRGLPDRVDKLHSIYGMARGITAGYIILAVLAATVLCSCIVTVIFAFLTAMFYIMAKKYLYRWTEWIFFEYEQMCN